MKAQELLRGQFQRVHQFLEMTLNDVTQDLASHKLDGSTLNTIGQIYGHIVVAEDTIVGGGLGGQTILSQDGWAEKTGVSVSSPMQDAAWADAKIDLAAFRAYAQAVFANTDRLLAETSEEDLMKPITTPFGEQPALSFISEIGLPHAAQHWGEIAALKGVRGMKGLPF